VAFPLEAVPNFSEGRDRGIVEALAAALGGPPRLLDVHVDADHNRSVFTLAGGEQELVEALHAGIACARGRIDLRAHEGVHPRVGAADVVPLVAVRAEDLERARAAAVELGRRVGEELGLAVFLYGAAGDGRGPAFFRTGGPVELERRLAAGELEPDFGPPRLDPAAGAVLVGARRPLIAFNVELLTGEVEVARAIAAVVREKGGGFPGVRALGLALPSRGTVQVSMNVEDPERVHLHEVVARIRAEAAAREVEAGDSELVGLLPAGVAAAASRGALGLPELDASRLLEVRLLADGELS
jgi:glutamate formiminotransferase / 5-formyltetrahydrofolate cyclo-ligase